MERWHQVLLANKNPIRKWSSNNTIKKHTKSGSVHLKYIVRKYSPVLYQKLYAILSDIY